MKERHSLDEILGDFSAKGPSDNDGQSRRAITTWIPPEYKTRYDRLQQKSGRQFSKKVRETVIELIEIAESRVG